MINTQEVAQRSDAENKYYHGVVVKEIALFKGWRPSSAHAWIKATFGVESTATLSTVEFEQLMDDVRSHVYKYWKLDILLPNN